MKHGVMYSTLLDLINKKEVMNPFDNNKYKTHVYCFWLQYMLRDTKDEK